MTQVTQVIYQLNDEQFTELYHYIMDDYQQCEELEVEPSDSLAACKDIFDQLIDQHKWFFPLAIYIHCGIVGLMKDSTPSLFIEIIYDSILLRLHDGWSYL